MRANFYDTAMHTFFTTKTPFLTATTTEVSSRSLTRTLHTHSSQAQRCCLRRSGTADEQSPRLAPTAEHRAPVANQATRRLHRPNGASQPQLRMHPTAPLPFGSAHPLQPTTRTIDNLRLVSR
mmetsp:Transcript_51107/g.136389  ORF Transcript_51107/g.136389 Transcript_51107/m.136389 type:complete len:123 (+) Transcript_51107:101-469(+)